MKKILKTITTLIMATLMTVTIGCKGNGTLVIKESDTYIVITASNEQMQITNDTTLVDYMNSLKEDGKLEFEMSGGMVVSINGIANPADWSSCWMFYTSDEDNANYAWGTIEYKSNLYGSTMYGAEKLKVKDGCMYILVFQSFS